MRLARHHVHVNARFMVVPVRIMERRLRAALLREPRIAPTTVFSSTAAAQVLEVFQCFPVQRLRCPPAGRDRGATIATRPTANSTATAIPAILIEPIRFRTYSVYHMARLVAKARKRFLFRPRRRSDKPPKGWSWRDGEPYNGLEIDNSLLIAARSNELLSPSPGVA